MVKVAPRKTFEEILAAGARQKRIPAMTEEARKWYRDQARKMKTNPTNLIRESEDRLKTRAQIGEMYHFFYDPKHKADLPYYDSFPLIFKIEEYSDSFLGINLHYLPLPLRAKLMDALYDLATNKKYNEKTKLAISYSILKGAARYKYFKPCIKKYLKAHVRSRFMKINANEWDIALMLPTEAFAKASKTQIWKESKDKI